MQVQNLETKPQEKKEQGKKEGRNGGWHLVRTTQTEMKFIRADATYPSSAVSIMNTAEEGSMRGYPEHGFCPIVGRPYLVSATIYRRQGQRGAEHMALLSPVQKASLSPEEYCPMLQSEATVAFRKGKKNGEYIAFHPASGRLIRPADSFKRGFGGEPPTDGTEIPVLLEVRPFVLLAHALPLTTNKSGRVEIKEGSVAFGRKVKDPRTLLFHQEHVMVRAGGDEGMVYRHVLDVLRLPRDKVPSKTELATAMRSLMMARHSDRVVKDIGDDPAAALFADVVKDVREEDTKALNEAVLKAKFMSESPKEYEAMKKAAADADAKALRKAAAK